MSPKEPKLRKSLWPKTVASTACLALLYSLLSSPQFAWGAETETARAQLARELPGLLVSLPDDPGGTVLSGTVLGNDHESVGAGTKVVLIAGPTERSLKKLAPGQSVTSRAVAVTVTDSYGRYSFRGSAINRAIRESPFQRLVALGTSDVAVGLVNANHPGGSGASMTANPGPDASDTATPATGRDQHTLVMKSTPARVGSLSVGPRSAVPMGAICSGDMCTVTSLIDDWNQPAIVAATASYTKNASASVTYKKSSSSTLGIGVSASSGTAGYSQSATTTSSSSAAWTFGSVSGVHQKYWRTAFVYGKYVQTVYFLGMVLDTSYIVKPTGSWAGGNYSYSTGVNFTSNNPARTPQSP